MKATEGHEYLIVYKREINFSKRYKWEHANS